MVPDARIIRAGTLEVKEARDDGKSIHLGSLQSPSKNSVWLREIIGAATDRVNRNLLTYSIVL